MTDRVVIQRDELYDKSVDEALKKERQLRTRVVADTPPDLSPLRRVMMSSLFYLPVAGLFASLLAWAIIEPSFADAALLGGEVLLVNSEPFEFGEGVDVDLGDPVNLTVGDNKVVVFPNYTRLEPGVHGQPAYNHISEVQPGAFVEVTGETWAENEMIASALRPSTPAQAMTTGDQVGDDGGWSGILLFPLTAIFIAVAMLVAEGMSTRNWVRMIDRVMIGILLTVVFSFLAYVPVFIVLIIRDLAASGDWTSLHDMPITTFIVFAAGRSAAWACMGAGLGLGMNIARATKSQLRNSVIGGTLGGALGGLFFDPIGRFFQEESAFVGGEVSRLVGLIAIGLCVGFFVALVDQLAREAWLRVRTGPLAGKSFVLYKTPTTVGSSPSADVYLFKDAGIDPDHVAIHQVGSRYEIEDLGTRSGTTVGGQPIRRQRLSSGDQITLGATVLEFEERAKRSSDS